MATRFTVTVSSGSSYLAEDDGKADDTLATSRLELVAEFPAGSLPKIALRRVLRINGDPEQRVDVQIGGTGGAAALVSSLRVMLDELDREAEARRLDPEKLQPEDPAALCAELLEFLEPMAGTSQEIDGWVTRLSNTVGA